MKETSLGKVFNKWGTATEKTLSRVNANRVSLGGGSSNKASPVGWNVVDTGEDVDPWLPVLMDDVQAIRTALCSASTEYWLAREIKQKSRKGGIRMKWSILGGGEMS